MFDCHVNAFSPFFLLSRWHWIGFSSSHKKREENNLYLYITWNGKVPWVRNLRMVYPPIFRLQKISTPKYIQMRVVFNNECELPLKMAFLAVTWFYLCFGNVTHVNLSSSSSSLLPLSECPSHVPFLSFTQRIFFSSCHLIRIESKSMRVYEQTQRTWDSNLLRWLLHQSNAKCV